MLGLPEAEAKEFADAILDAKKSVTCCPVCQNFTAGGLCPICASPKRDGSVICVVADPRAVAAIEPVSYTHLGRPPPDSETPHNNPALGSAWRSPPQSVCSIC